MAVLYSTNFASDDLATNWTVIVGTWAITGGVLRCSAGAQPRSIRTDSTAYAAVADMRVDVKYAAGTSFDGGPTVRHQSAADTCYYVEASATGIDVFRRVAGVDSATLGSRSGAALGDTIGLEVTGVGATVTLKVFKNGVQQGADILDTNAARIVAAGWGGILEWSSTGNQDFDDFSVDDLAAAPGTTAPLGWFDPKLRAEAWFDPKLIAVAWFDKRLIDVAAAGGGGSMAVISHNYFRRRMGAGAL